LLEATVNFTDVDSSGFYPLHTRDNINFNLGGSKPLQTPLLLYYMLLKLIKLFVTV